MEEKKKPHLLVCDDEQGIRDSLKLILGDLYEITFVTNGQEAVDSIRRCEPDLALLDIKMPRVDGMDALRQIKALKPQVRVLMISGYESMDVAGQAIQCGAADYITKPFDRRTVLEKVQGILDHPAP